MTTFNTNLTAQITKPDAGIALIRSAFAALFTTKPLDPEEALARIARREAARSRVDTLLR